MSTVFSQTGPAPTAVPRAVSRRSVVHAGFWILLALFPVSLVGDGDVRTAQVLLHAVLGVYMVAGFVLTLGSQPVRLEAPGGWVVAAYLCGTLGYFCFLTSLNMHAGAMGDFLDVTRPLVYAAYVLFPFLVRLDDYELVRLLKLLVLIAVIQVIFSAAVYLPPAWPFIDVFKGRPSDDSVLFHFFRWSGTSGYPSDFAFYTAFFLYLVYFAPRGVFTAARRWTLVGLFSIGLVMTMSRGGIASTVAMVGLGSLLFGRLKSLFVLMALGALALGATVAIDSMVEQDLVNPNYVLDLVEQGTQAESARHRVKEIELAGEYSSKYFPFGAGAARDAIYSQIRVIESLYGHYLVKWGYLGLALFLVSCIYLAWAGWTVGVASPDGWLRAFGRAFFLMTLSVPLVFGWSSAISDRFKGLPFYYLLAGYVVAMTVRMLRQERTARQASMG